MAAVEPRLESDLEKRFQRMVRERGGMCIKMAPTVKGTPDRLVVTSEGMLYLVELKTVTGTLSPRQRLWHAQAKERKLKVHVLYGLRDMRPWVDAYV